MKKILSLITAGLLSVSVFAGCGDTASSGLSSGSETKAGESAASTTAKEETTDLTTITIGATSAPHAEILAQIVDDLKAEGIELVVTEFNDYQQLNPALSAGDIDANYFQHQPFLDTYNSEKNDTLVSVGKIHYEPFGIYAGKTKSLADLADGAEIAIPNDTTNGARALLLLQQEGLIKLKDGAGLEASALDIAENPHNYKITEIAAAQLPRSVADVDVAVINGNYAIEAGFQVKDALAVEASDSLAAETFGNVLAVRAEDKDSEAIQKVLKALKSDKVKTFIEETYAGGVVPLF